MKTQIVRVLAPLFALGAFPALAANGLSDDRVSLPDGPGSIGGVGENIDINANMGSSSYSVAIEVPAGATSEMTPDLALTYSSGNGLGLAGIGWDYAWPVIERTTAKGLPDYDTDDLFSADGSDLVYVGDVGGAREYRARFEGAFARYRWHDAGAGEAGYWTAEYPDGRTAWFGATPEGSLVPSARVTGGSGQTFAYHLVELRDTVGRRIVQTYTKPGGWPLLDEVQYGFGGQSTPRFSVRAAYEARPDVVSDATPGHVIQLSSRLGELAVYSGALRIKRYELVYEDDADAGGMSRLERVSVYGRDGGKLPIEHTFRYSRSLGGACDAGCEQPFLVDMGTLPGGVSIGTGRAALIDINGDSLPDVVSSDESGLHTFHISSLAGGDQPSFSGAGALSTMGGTDLRFVLGAPQVQLFDVNGDGFVDIVDQVNATALCNYGDGDWSSAGCVASPDELPTLEDDPGDAASDDDPLGMRFFDYNNDKRMDLLRTTAVDAASVYVNTGGGFTTTVVEAIGAQFDVERLELSDLNGDGLLDPVELTTAGPGAQVRYRLNLGFGRWAPAVNVTIADLSAAEFDDAELEDIDGDGLADIVVVAGTTISYWRNLNGDRFSARVDIESDDVTGGIPVRDGNETVLFADMNGNGTDDVVFISSAGAVRFVELFPVRPNLLSRVENGIGWVRTLSYGTAIAERARDEGTAEAWLYKNPLAMVVVKEADNFVTLSGADGGVGLHEVARYEYRDAWYDPSEKAFRGFERVRRYTLADTALDSQDPGLEVMVYDVGRDDEYRAGRMLTMQTFGGPSLDVPIREERTEYGDCDLGGALATLTPPVRFTCATAKVTVHQEGAPESEWVTVREEMDYDIYGNVIEQRLLGVVHYGPPEAPAACPACDGAAGLDSGACGALCEGDETVVEMTYVVPGVDTGGAWLARLVQRSLSSNGAGDPAETLYYYDGDDFVGLPAGQATRGLLTRVENRVSSDELVPAARSAWDANGNLLASLEANGDPADATRYRRDYAYDERGLRLTKVTVHAGDYDLVQEVSYESDFLQPSEATRFFLVEDGTTLTNRNSSRYRYDEHGRLTALVKPGDSDAAPSEEYSYDLADPVSRIVVRKRRTPGGPADVVQMLCMDGRGQQVSLRIGTGDGTYLVEGLLERNARNEVVREYLPFTSESTACETAAPEGVGFTRYRYDALARQVETTLPDASLFGAASVRRTVHLPLTTESWDEEDTAPGGAHAGTPTRTITDGLGRAVLLERVLEDDTLASYRLAYDARGHLARVDGPGGSLTEQEHDFLGRVVSVSEDNRGVATFVYDAQGLLVSHTDARGVTVENEYDALGRPVASWDADDPDGTREETRYDYDASCDDCRNAAGDVVGTSYAGGSDAYGYDPRGRRVMVRKTLEGLAFTTTYEHDGVDSVVSITYPDGQVVETQHDGARRPVRVPGFVSAVGYSPQGRLVRVEHANGGIETRGYDVLLRPSSLRIGDFYDVALTRDRAGNVTTVASSGTGLSRAASYQQDAFYRTTSALLHGGERLEMSFDLDENIIAMTSTAADSVVNVGSFSYDTTRKNAVTAAGSLSYSYDEAGNVSRRGDVAFTWDHLSRLVAAAPSGAEGARFSYDRDRTRVIKEEEGGVAYYPAPDFVVRDGISTVYVRLGGLLVARNKSAALASSLLPDADSDGDIDIADAALGSDGPAATRLLRAAARRVLFASADPYAALHEDLSENLVAATDEGGALLGEREYFPYGEIRRETAFLDERGFSRQERDSSTGLLAFDERYLDPVAGRWLSPDPAFGVLDVGALSNYGQATTAYAYVGNNTINASDPTGLLGKKLVKKAKKRAGQLKRKVSKKARTKHTRNKLYGELRDLQEQRIDMQTLRNKLSREITMTMRAPGLLEDGQYAWAQARTKTETKDRRIGREWVPVARRVDDYSGLNELFHRAANQAQLVGERSVARELVDAEIGALDARIQDLKDRINATYEQKRAQASRPERTRIVNNDLQSTFGISLDLYK